MFTENIGQPGGRGGVTRAGLDERGHNLSKQDVRMAQSVSSTVLCPVLKTERVMEVRIENHRG